jgi:hypothetical protein
MNRMKQIESTPALTELIRIARRIATSENDIIGATILARRRNPELAEEAARELARLDAAVESTAERHHHEENEEAA